MLSYTKAAVNVVYYKGSSWRRRRSEIWKERIERGGEKIRIGFILCSLALCERGRGTEAPLVSLTLWKLKFV